VDGAFVIIAWVGIKLLLQYLHDAGFVGFEIPKWLSLGLVVVIFVVSLIWARLEGPAQTDSMTEEAEKILAADDEMVAKIDGDVTK
jgi:predicted tellurium resistance membrane protein TerC